MWVTAAVAAVVVSLAVPAVRHLREQPPPPPPPLYLAFEPPAGSVAGGGDDALDAAISPDESTIVFVASTDGVARLWRRFLETGRTEVLPGTDGAQLPAWKGTGRVVSFFSGGKLRQVSLTDGVVSDLADVPVPGGATWTPDGSLLFASGAGGPIRRMTAGRVSDATSLSPGDRGHTFPAAANGLSGFTYVAFRDDGRRTVRLVTATGERELTDTTGHAQIAAGFLVYARGGILLAQRFGMERGAVIGRSTPLAPSVGVSTTGHGMFAVSPRLLLYADAPPRPVDVGWIEPGSGALTRIAEPGDFWQLRLSPEDRFAAVTATAPLLRTLDVFLFPTSGDLGPQALTRALAADSDPVWSPDGRRVIFRSLQTGQPALFARPIGSSEADEEPVPAAERGDTATDWRGTRLLVHTAAAGATRSDVWEIDTATRRRAALVTDGFSESDARWSPDGAWIAYVSDESGQPDIYAMRTDGTGGRLRVSLAGGSKPRWSRDGRSVFFLRGSRIMRADFGASAPPRFETAVPILEAAGIRDFDVAPRSGRLAVLMPAPSGRPPVTGAIVNWPSVVDGGSLDGG